jgi:hypothetical protein
LWPNDRTFAAMTGPGRLKLAANLTALGLGNTGIATIDSIADFSEADDCAHDGHFNPDGARKAAEAVLPWVQDVVAY